MTRQIHPWELERHTIHTTERVLMVVIGLGFKAIQLWKRWVR